MTPGALAKKIKMLRLEAPITTVFERALIKRGVWIREGAWYSTQKQHWLGWLAEYNGPGAYNRKTWRGRSAEFVYNHVVCSPMLLWLAEAAGVPKGKLRIAKRAMLGAGPRLASQAAALRQLIPWSVIEDKLRPARGTLRSVQNATLKSTARRTTRS